MYRHTITPPGRFSLPDSRFQHVHIDLVGPLPPSNGFSYIFTCVDRYTRWPVATPIRDISAEMVAKSFIESWVSNFGSPTTITTDRGCQFTSALFPGNSKIYWVVITAQQPPTILFPTAWLNTFTVI